MRPYLRLAFVFYVVATSLGAALRFGLVGVPLEGLDFGNALHAHSHTLYFGWAALALLALVFRRLGAEDRGVRALLWAVVAVSAATFPVFLVWGYRPPGVVVSSASLFVWAWAIALVLRRARGQAGVDVAYLRVAAVYVGLAGLAALARVVILLLKVADPLPGQLAVFGFLDTFAGFFVLGLMGLLAHHAAVRGAPLDERRLRWQLWLLTPLLALTFPLGVPGGMHSALGPLARGATGLLLVPQVLWVHNLWTAAGRLERREAFVLRTLAGAWALKALLELAGALGLAEAATQARHPAILYLHLVLLGIVTGSLLLLAREALGRGPTWVLPAHFGAVAVLLAGLAVAGLPALVPVSLPVMDGLWLAAIGGVLVVGVGAHALVEAFFAEAAR